MKQNGEPSVEEILASIKQVIARDNPEVATFDPRRRGASAFFPEPGPQADVLDLGDAELVEPAEPETPLLNADAHASMRESLAALAALSGPGAAPQIVRSGETSLEGLARDLLRPALTEWLDRNLPSLVEKLVAAEIARIVGKKG
jgi:cell pole-organizing protein PopZ